MFSTVDSPGARYLKAYLVFEEGEMRVSVPRRLKRDSQRVRTLPSAQNLDIMVKRLAEQTWVRWNYHEAYLSSDPTREASATVPSESSPMASDLSEDSSIRLAADVAARDKEMALRQQGSYPKLRILGRNEPAPTAEQEVCPLAVRVELWKYTFDGVPNELTAERLLEIQCEVSQ